MKDFDLNACGVTEMNRQEMLNVDGGNIFKDAWNAICNAAEAVWDWICGAIGSAKETFKDVEFDWSILPSGCTF